MIEAFGYPGQPATGAVGLAEQVEVVMHEPDDAIDREAVEQICTDHVVIGTIDRLVADVEKRGGCPAFGVWGRALREVEGVRRMVERGPHGVDAQRLFDALMGEQQLEQVGAIERFLPHAAATATGALTPARNRRTPLSERPCSP